LGKTEPYKPRPEAEAILDRAYELVQSVPYAVTARWLFYGLLQEGTYPDKDSYKSKFLPMLSKARKTFFKNWRPDTLADDTRSPVVRGEGFPDEKEWLEAVGRARCKLDKWRDQQNYVEIWFEAKAMRGQFEHFTKHITLRPFGGDPSIPYKWQIAKELEEAADCYEKPIVILYFGDLDPKGVTIPESALADIRSWCKASFECYRCGLNRGDEIKYNLPENPDKPGTYQWEAMSHEAAKELINRAVNQFVSQGYFANVEQEETEITERFQQMWRQQCA
jgi:hypothetical protein